jgi:hypothetical protein
LAFGRLFDKYGLSWFLGSALIGVVYDYSVRGAVGICVTLEIAAIPFFIVAQRHMSRILRRQ